MIDESIRFTITLNHYNDIAVHLEAHNNTVLTGRDYSRRQQFEQVEKDVLKPLNKYSYDPMSSKVATVGKTGYVPLDYRYYSIPYKFIGKKVKLMYNRTKVEAITLITRLLLCMNGSYGKEKYIQNQEHLASWHRYPTEWNPEKFIADANSIDPTVANYIKNVLARNEYPEKNYRACQGIINFKKRVGDSGLLTPAGGPIASTFTIMVL